MPAKFLRFDTTRVVWATAPTKLPEAACAEDADCCAPLAEVAVDCAQIAPRCEAATCSMRLTLERALPLFLLREVPDLAVLGRDTLARLRVRAVRVQADSERFPGPLEDVTVLVGPYAAQSAKHPDARRLAVVPALEIGKEHVAEGLLVPESPRAFERITRAPSEPFSLIAVANLAVRPGATVPKGEMIIAVELALETSLGL